MTVAEVLIPLVIGGLFGILIEVCIRHDVDFYLFIVLVAVLLAAIAWRVIT